jgi:hypothetical protein
MTTHEAIKDMAPMPKYSTTLENVKSRLKPPLHSYIKNLLRFETSLNNKISGDF